MNGAPHRRRVDDQIVIPGLTLDPMPRPTDFGKRDAWVDRVRAVLSERSRAAPEVAEQALRACPGDLELTLLAALAALAAAEPDRCLIHLKRVSKRYGTPKSVTLLKALALAQQRQFPQAWTMLRGAGLQTVSQAMAWFVGDDVMADWLRGWFVRIQRQGARSRATAGRAAAPAQPVRTRAPRSQIAAAAPAPVAAPAAAAAAPIPDLPRLDASFELRFELANRTAIQTDGRCADANWFRLRGELMQLGMLQGFDELLCLPALRGVDLHEYQVETARKVLKQFRGRVLLADEVGLGKTIEAGMILKEYILRGMAERVLVLTPAALVEQWREELQSKFGIDFATSYDALLRRDPAQFWLQPRVIASIAAARREEHAESLAGLSYDVVIVDEAHHLKDQASASHRLVNSLQKRFLLLLSATPVQNDLIELYNLLTLLQPGIFRTPKEFRAAYMIPGKPREPVNRDRLRDLMRGVMVRNTRALAALRLPPRRAATLRARPSQAEGDCYSELTALVREAANAGMRALSAEHVLGAAGSSPAAAAASIARLVARHQKDARWAALLARYRANTAGAKEAALLELLARNPTEKKIVFVHYRHSLAHLAGLLREQGMPFATFEGGMSGPEKDAAITAFRDAIPVLLCSESGGEGRNLQFCNTLINFDIPWNPMTIEQRIGRIDRIGQTREVFVFNLATKGTLEDEVLRILDEKINMFELVVGEVGAILGELDEQQDFSALVLDAWLQTADDSRRTAFAALEDQLMMARRQYHEAKQLDEALFGDDLEAA